MTKNYRIKFTIYYEDGNIRANEERVIENCYSELQAKIRCEQEIRSNDALSYKRIRSIYMYECREDNPFIDMFNEFNNKG